MKNKSRVLNFSEKYIHVEYIESAEHYFLMTRTIVINLAKQECVIANQTLKPNKSAIFENIELKDVKKLLLITLEMKMFSIQNFPHSQEIVEKWHHVYNIFPVEHLKKTNLWRSQKDTIENIDVMLWFAKAGTHCGIHNEHSFNEVHTQIFGLGRMQKFHQNDKNTLYQELYMSPGYTHDPFCDENNKYPWHQYYADTDCIWLVLEINER